MKKQQSAIIALLAGLCINSSTFAKQELTELRQELIRIDVRIVEAPIGWSQTVAKQLYQQNSVASIQQPGPSSRELLMQELQNLQTSEKGRPIAAPILFTVNGEPAWVELGVEFIYPQASASSAATAVEFRKSTLLFEVTPYLIPAGQIKLYMQAKLFAGSYPQRQAQALRPLVNAPVQQLAILKEDGVVMLSPIYRLRNGLLLKTSSTLWQQLSQNPPIHPEQLQQLVNERKSHFIELVIFSSVRIAKQSDLPRP